MRLRRFWLLLGALLAACASGPSVRSDEGPPEEVVSSFKEGCEDERAVILLCNGRECGFFQCRDLESGGVMLTRGGGGVIAPPAAPGGSPRRWWGRPLMRSNSEPILIFRFYSSQDPKPPLPQLPPGRYVRHHIFPQAPDLKAWFKGQGVGIHRFVLIIPEHVHRCIHSGGSRGGLWNEAWREFQLTNERATPDEIYRHAGELIYRFELTGPVVPYYSPRL